MIDAELRLPGWGHQSGILGLKEAVPPTDAASCADRQLIMERIHRYCWGYDERQTEALGACFTEDAVWEGNVLGRIKIGPFTGRETIINWLQEFWPHQHDQRRHMILNTIVEEQTSDRATTWSYLLLLSSKGTSISLETSGFYKVSYRREGAQWRIAHLMAGFDKPFWPGELEKLSPTGRNRHGIDRAETQSAPGKP